MGKFPFSVSGFFSLNNILFLIVLINFFAGIYSLQYYATNLASSHPIFWVVVADCPIFSGFFGLCLILLILGKLNPYFALLSIVGNIKYGFWSIFILTLQGLVGVYPLFIVSHLLLIIETLIFFRMFSFRLKHVLFVLGWFLFSDFMDYYFLLHPPFDVSFFFPVALFSIISTFVIVLLVSVFFSKNESSSFSKNVSSLFWSKAK